jgi:hypothetical protein
MPKYQISRDALCADKEIDAQVLALLAELTHGQPEPESDLLITIQPIDHQACQRRVKIELNSDITIKRM